MQECESKGEKHWGELLLVALLTLEDQILGFESGISIGPGVYEQKMLVSHMFVNTPIYFVKMGVKDFGAFPHLLCSKQCPGIDR